MAKIYEFASREAAYTFIDGDDPDTAQEAADLPDGAHVEQRSDGMFVIMDADGEPVARPEADVADVVLREPKSGDLIACLNPLPADEMRKLAQKLANLSRDPNFVMFLRDPFDPGADPIVIRPQAKGARGEKGDGNRDERGLTPNYAAILDLLLSPAGLTVRQGTSLGLMTIKTNMIYVSDQITKATKGRYFEDEAVARMETNPETGKKRAVTAYRMREVADVDGAHEAALAFSVARLAANHQDSKKKAKADKAEGGNVVEFSEAAD